MRVLVCGGRDYMDWGEVYDRLDAFSDERPISLLFEGGAKGTDCWARSWAENRKVPVQTYLADWPLHGLSAGPIRNRRMLDEGKPDVVIAFPGGRGTANMVLQARAAGVEVIEVSSDSPPSPERGRLVR
jgi:hypothetical protein